ncbi:MAG: hypothetical protein IPK19_03825 [Chloroflexi bacterium]|nr:hypothetical protein [Chloroflexota bacterium]
MKSHPSPSGAFTALLFAAALLAGCVAQPESAVPTVANLPTTTNTPPPTETLPPTDAGAAVVGALTVEATATIELSPTEEPLGAIWYANGEEELVYVYDCRELTCGKIATFARGEAVEVLAVDGDWTLVRLEDGSLAYVQALDLQETPVSTASPTPTETPTATATATRTPSPTGTRPTPTFTWTLGAPGTAIPTLPLIGPSIIGGVIGLPGGTSNPDGVIVATFPPPTSVGRQPPGVPTLTPSRTLSPTPSTTLSIPMGTSTLPPFVVPTTAGGGATQAPPNTPPGAGSPVPTSGPPVGGTLPPTQATTPTFGPPPGVLVTPPGA